MRDSDTATESETSSDENIVTEVVNTCAVFYDLTYVNKVDTLTYCMEQIRNIVAMKLILYKYIST